MDALVIAEIPIGNDCGHSRLWLQNFLSPQASCSSILQFSVDNYRIVGCSSRRAQLPTNCNLWLPQWPYKWDELFECDLQPKASGPNCKKKTFPETSCCYSKWPMNRMPVSSQKPRIVPIHQAKLLESACQSPRNQLFFEILRACYGQTKPKCWNPRAKSTTNLLFWGFLRFWRLLIQAKKSVFRKIQKHQQILLLRKPETQNCLECACIPPINELP